MKAMCLVFWDCRSPVKAGPSPAPEAGSAGVASAARQSPYSTDYDPIFTHPEGTGKPLDPSYVSRAFAAAIKAAGLPPRRFHDLRHTFAIRAAQTGIPLTDVQAYLGHADISTTGRYARYVERPGEADRLQAALLAGISDLTLYSGPARRVRALSASRPRPDGRSPENRHGAGGSVVQRAGMAAAGRRTRQGTGPRVAR